MCVVTNSFAHLFVYISWRGWRLKLLRTSSGLYIQCHILLILLLKYIIISLFTNHTRRVVVSCADYGNSYKWHMNRYPINIRSISAGLPWRSCMMFSMARTPNDPRLKTSLMCAWASNRCVSQNTLYSFSPIYYFFLLVISEVFNIL